MHQHSSFSIQFQSNNIHNVWCTENYYYLKMVKIQLRRDYRQVKCKKKKENIVGLFDAYGSNSLRISCINHTCKGQKQNFRLPGDMLVCVILYKCDSVHSKSNWFDPKQCIVQLYIQCTDVFMRFVCSLSLYLFRSICASHRKIVDRIDQIAPNNGQNIKWHAKL